MRGFAVSCGVNGALKRCTCSSEAICFRLVTGKESRGTFSRTRMGGMFSLRVFAMDRRPRDGRWSFLLYDAIGRALFYRFMD